MMGIASCKKRTFKTLRGTIPANLKSTVMIFLIIAALDCDLRFKDEEASYPSRQDDSREGL